VKGLVFRSQDASELGVDSGAEVLYADFETPSSALGILEIAWPAKGPGAPSATYREVSGGKLVFAGKTVELHLDVGPGRDPEYGSFALIAVEDGAPQKVRAIAAGWFGELPSRAAPAQAFGGGGGDVGGVDWLDIDVYVPPDPAPSEPAPSEPAPSGSAPSEASSAPESASAPPDVAVPASADGSSGSGCTGDSASSSSSNDSGSGCGGSDSGSGSGCSDSGSSSSGSGCSGCEGDAAAASLGAHPRPSHPLRGLAQFLWPSLIAGAFNRLRRPRSVQ
jgi:hypothetical protein